MEIERAEEVVHIGDARRGISKIAVVDVMYQKMLMDSFGCWRKRQRRCVLRLILTLRTCT